MIRSSRNLRTDPPLVVKLGGSLCCQVPDLVTVLRAAERPLFIVPGGGMFADTVRNCQVADDSAHWMAIAAMEQYGWFIAAHGIPATAQLQVQDGPVVFLPYCILRHHDPLPHSWDVTSDTIAAWIADFLGVECLLLKSTDGIFENGCLLEEVDVPMRTDVVDPFFIPFVLEKELTTTIINGSYPDRVEKFLRGEEIPGTRIGTTF